MNFNNKGPVQNQAGRDLKIGTSLTPLDKAVGPNVMLDCQYNYHGPNPETLLGLAAAP